MFRWPWSKPKVDPIGAVAALAIDVTHLEIDVARLERRIAALELAASKRARRRYRRKR